MDVPITGSVHFPSLKRPVRYEKLVRKISPILWLSLYLEPIILTFLALSMDRKINNSSGEAGNKRPYVMAMWKEPQKCLRSFQETC